MVLEKALSGIPHVKIREFTLTLQSITIVLFVFCRYLSVAYPDVVALTGFSPDDSRQCHLGENFAASYIAHIGFFIAAISFIITRFPESIFPGNSRSIFLLIVSEFLINELYCRSTINIFTIAIEKRFGIQYLRTKIASVQTFIPDLSRLNRDVW